MLNTNTTEKLMAEGGLPQTSPQIPDNSKFEFESVYDFFSPPDTPEFNQIMDPQYENMLRQHAQQINTYAPAAIGNLNTPTPTLASATYNPTRQRTGYDLSTPDGIAALLKDNSGLIKSDKPIIANPIAAGIRESGFDRYYKHSQFSKLGWHPYADNESFYNANSTWWDDFGRMSSQFGNLTKTGFVSAYRSIGDLFDSDSYFSGTDMESAAEFSDAMRIGNSTRGGFAGFANNLALQLGYTTGIIGSIAVEELALFSAAALQGGFNPVADGVLATRTAFNIGRLGRSIANAFDITRFASATRNMYNTLRSVDAAKDFYSTVKTGGKLFGQVFAPETYRAIRTLNSTANGAQNLSNMAKVSMTFGGFYRDLRSLNLALSESKMEGGMVYAQQLANNYDYYSEKNNGSPVTPEQMQLITENASRAAYWTTVQNAPTIFFSNQLLLGNAFGAYNRSLARILNDNIGGLAGRVIRARGFKEAGKIVTRPFVDAGAGLKGFYNTIKAAGVRGSLQMGAHASLRYFAANLAEGIQEVTQEAISHGTKDYHLSILKDPTSGGRNLLSASIASAVSSQWNAQGFETFMSGFLMGGLAQGPQKLLFQGIPNLYQRTFEKEKFEEYKKNKEKYITNLVDSLNDAYEITANDPMSSIFDTNKVNLVAQKQAGIDVMQSMFDNSEFDFVDAKDYAKFQSIYTVLSSGKVSDFRSQFRDYLKMTNDELAEVFPASKADIKSGKVATRMQDMLNKIDQLEDSYNENKDKYRNPFNSSLYKPGTREYGEERIKEMSFEHTRYLYMFTEDGFKRALERSKSIYDELASDPIVGKMAASDITVLLDEKSLAKEITTLVQEITLLDSKESKDIIEAKTNKLKGLQNLFNVLYGPENLNTKGVFDKRKIKKLEEAFQSYVQLLAKSNNTFADSDKIRAALKKIIDYKKLGERAIAYSKSIEYMNNPDRFDEIRNRAYDFYKLIFKNRAEVFRESIKNYISKTEINQFLNELNKLNVIPDPQEVEEFMENGNIDVLENFYSEDGIVNQNNDQDTYNQIQALINIYKSAVTPEVTEQTAEEKIDSKEKQTRKKDTAEILAEADLAENTPDVEIFGGKETDNPMIKQVLEKKYKEYVNRQVNLGKVPIAMDSWVNSPDAAKYITAYESLKKLWFKDLQSDTRKTDTPEEVLANFNADNGFDKWLETQQTNDFVRKIFRSTETNFSDFIDIEQDFEAGNIEDADIGDVKAVGKVVDNTFNSVQIIETKTSIVDPDTGMPVPVTLYSVRDKKGKLLTEDMTSAAGVPVGATFDNINKARSAAKKLDDVSVDTSTFTFGGKEVSYGSVVTDSEGNRYMVIGTPAEVEKGKKLFLLPVDSIKPGQSKQDRHKLSKKVTEPEFKSEYNVEGFNFNKVPKDASRLLVDEAVALYPLENGMGTAAAEGIMIANARLQTILDNLTPEEKAGLTLVVTRNPAGGKTTGKKYQTKDEEGNFKEANPYINRVAEPFAVGIAFGNQQTATRINQIIAEKGMPASSHPDGVFAFVRTGSIQFLNEKNQVVNPINLTKEIIENTFTIYPSQQANAVNTIVNNFAIQQAFVEQVADKMQGKDAAIIPMSEFAEFGFNLGSSVDLRSNPKSVKELKHNTVDGVKVLMINDRKNGIISTRILTDIEDIDEREAFIEKLKQDLATSQPGLFESLQKAQRYVALIKTPNGIYTGAPLKSERLDENTIFNLGKELVEEGIKTINENLDGEGSVETKKIKNKNFNVEFNQAFNRKLYITTNIEGYTVEINVNSDGTFRAELYDKNSKSVIGSSYLAEGRQGTLDYQGVEKPDIIQRLLDNLQTKGIDKAAEEFKAKKKKDSSVEIPEWTKLKLSINNVRASFEEDASIDTVLNNTVTTLNENVRTNYKLRLTANSSTVQEALLFAATTAARQQETEAVKDPTVNLETSEEAYDSVLDMSDEVFDKFAKADFKELPLYMKQQVANKIAKGEKLSLREERIVKNGVAGPLIQLLAGKIQRNTNVDSNAQSLTKELKENRARITEIEREIDTAEPDMVKASELMEDNPERQKLIARNREIERKLIANKIVSEKLNEQEVADIDEFVIWASANLPDFISIDDIYNLRDNLVTNGMRVGAFVLSMSQIASGMTVKGTLYTGVKSPYKYHEAFHGVFRSLLSNAQQDKLYKIAEAEVKRKLGDKFEEELEKFRNSANSYKAMNRKALEKEFYEEYMADEFEKFKKDPKSTKTDPAIKNWFNRLIEWIKSIFSKYNPNELQQLFKDIDSGKFKSASPINNRFTDSLATGITLNANKIIPVEMIESETGAFGYRTLDNDFARSVVSSISARVIMLEQENKDSNFNVKKAVNDSFNRFKALYSTKREAYKTMELTPEQKRNLRDIEKAFSEFSTFIKEAVYDELKYYEIKSRKIEEDLEDTDDQVGDRLRTTDQYDKDITSIGGFSSLSSFLRKYIGTTPISEKDQFGNDYLIAPERDENGEIVEGTGEKLMITVDFATAYNGFLKAVKNVNDPIQILQRLYYFGINNPQTEAVVNKLFLDLGIKWDGQLEKGELPQYTAKVIKKFKKGAKVSVKELNQGVKRPLLLQAVLKGFENARVDYLFIHRSSGDKVYTYTAANRDDANTQVDRWGQAYIQKYNKLRTDEGTRKTLEKTLDKLLERLQFVKSDSTTQKSLKTLTDTKLENFAKETVKVLQENLGISLSPKFIEFSVAKNILNPSPYQKALLNANSDEKALDYQDINQIKLIVAANQDLFTADEGARNRLKKIALGNAAFDENIGASVFKNPNGDLVYAHQLPSFHLKQMAALNDVADNGSKIEELKKSDQYLINNFLLNSNAFKQLSAEGRIRILRIAGSKTGNIDLDENGLMSETSGRTPTSGTTYGDSTPKEFILNLINAYTYAVDSLTGKVNTVSWTKEDGTTDVAALAPVLLRVLESSNTGDMAALPVFKAVDKKGGKTILTEEALDAILNNIAAEFARIQKESNPETATQELHVGYNALAIPNAETGTEEIIPINLESSSVDNARAFNFHKTGVLLSPLGQKKESRQGIVTIQTSDIKLERIEKGNQTSLIYDQKTAEQYIGFTSTGVVRDAIVKTKDGDKNIPKKIIGRGLVRVTPENRETIFEDLKGSISLIENDQFKYKVQIGTKKFYVESINEMKFLQGKKPMYMYDLIDAGETDAMEQIAGLAGGFEVEGYLNKLTEAARSPEFMGLTFAEAIQKLGIKESELKAFLQNRMNQEFAKFNITLDELIGSQGGLGSFITNGIQTSAGAVTPAALRSNTLLNIIPEDIEYNLKQIFFNDYINTTAINQILLGDSAYSLKDAVDEIKRAKAQSAAYYSAASTVSAPEYGIFKPLQELSLFELTEPIVNSTHNKGKVKNADAQLWMTTKAFRNFQYGFGKLTPAQAELFDRIERGDDISAEDIFGTEESTGYAKRQEMLNSQKLVYADGKTFVKMSAFPLLPQFTSLKDSEGNYTIPKPNKIALHNLRVKLEAFEEENDTVAVAAPRSALKMMQKNVSNIHSITGTTTPLGKDQSVTLDANYLGLQVINPSNKTIITDPTQVKSLVTSEQNDSTEVIINGKKLTLGEVRAAYHKATRDRGNLNYINKRNLVFSFDIDYAMDELQKSIKENAITADLYTYLRYAEASLASTGSSSHLMELFSLDESGNQKYNLNNPLTYDKFLSLFMSYFSKSVFNEKIPGATISLASDYGVRIYRKVFSVDENGMPDKHQIITEAQYEAMANKPTIMFNIDEGSYPGNDENLAGLEDAIKKSKGDGVIIVDRLRHNMKEYDSKGKATGQTYGEMLLPPHHKEVMKELQLKGKSIPDIIGKMFAIRIPSQDNHSTYNVKWIDFMPAAYGSTGIFARELIEISGADFDIDKVYTQFKEFYEKNGEFFEYGKAETEDNKYFDYVRYVNEKVKDQNSIYGEALYKYNGRGVGKNISITDSDLSTAKSRGLKEDSINALLVLGMPVTLAQYKAYKKKFGHEPYAAAINNDILDYKVALMGNDYVTKRKPLFLKETTSEKKTVQPTQSTASIGFQEYEFETIYSELGKETPSEKVIIDEVAGRKPAVEGNLPTKDVKINIYAGANQNTELSNFAIRPFKTNVETSSGSKEYTFQSVEQGFHFYKAVVANNPQVAAQILKTTNGGTLRNLTSRSNLKMTPEQVKEWDDTSKSIMLNLMYDSYVQNPDKAQLLLNTGEATITHTQDNTRWKTDFPEIVMTVRDMLREEGFDKNQSSKPIIAYRTRGNNFLEAFEKDNAIGNPWSHLGNGQNTYNFDDISNVFVLSKQVAFNKLEPNQEGDFNINSKVLLVREENLEPSLRHELVHEFINQLPEDKKKTIYKNILLFSDKLENDKELTEKYKGSLSQLKQLQKEYIKEKNPIFYAEELINIGLGNRKGFELITKLIKDKYGNEFNTIITDIDLNRIENKIQNVVKRNKIEINPQPYGHKYTIDFKNQYGLYKTNTVKEAVEEFIAWMIGEKHTDKLQDYRQAIIDKIPELKGKTILYYKDLGEPSHATALDYLINKYDWNKPSTQPAEVETVTEELQNLIEEDDKTYTVTTVNTGIPYLDENGVQKTEVPISYKAADLAVLQELWNELKTELPEWAALAEEEGIDVDNLFGKLRMFANNKEGSRSIGAVVLPNLYLNLLQEYDVKIASEILGGVEILPQIEFAGVTFRDFKNTYELYENGSQGQRTQYIISALITAATDNAKERLLAKLGLNINALSVVANLVALGVPVKTSVLLVNHPVIRQAYFIENNASEDEKISARTIVQERISSLQKIFLEPEERKMRTSVTQNSLMEAIETPLIKANATEYDMQELRENNEVTKMQVIEEISILEQFLNAATLSNTTKYMGDILNLTNGLGQGLEAIDKRNEAVKKLALNLSDKEFLALGTNRPMIDARPIFKGATWQAGYLERFQEFTNFLLPKVVLSASPLFRRITDEVIYQTTVNSLPYELRDKTKTKIARDFLSYLTIKAYMQNGLVNNSQSVASLTNALIYNQEGVENITAVVERLRATEEGSNNYFLNSFIIPEKATLKGNKTGLNLAGANTFLRYNDSQKLDIQNGFMILYANPLTRFDAKTLVHYMMVKDGLQYGYKSIVESVAPIALDGYLSHIDTVQAAIERPNDTVFQSTFGMKLDDLVIDFMQGYLTSAPNAYVIKKVRAPIYAPETKGITIENKVFTKAIVTSNPEAIYVFGDNVAKQGTVGNSSVRGLDNTFGLFFKKDMNRIESSYYTDAEAGDFITIFDEQVEQLKNMIAEGKQVIFPKDLITTLELADFKKNSPVVFAYVKAKLLQDLQYNIDPKAKKSTEEKKAAKVADPSILRAPVHVNASGLVPRLVVDLYAGISRRDKTNNVSSLRNIPPASKLTKQLAITFARNKKALSKAGFRNIIDLKKGSDYHSEVEFPIVIRQNIGSEFKAEYKYYILSKTQSLFPAQNLINITNKAVGSYAEYIEVDIKGSNAQNPIGFMFGERPTTKELRSFVNIVNSSDPLNPALESSNLDAALDADLEKGVKIPEGSVIVATEKGIQVNGENISKVRESLESTENQDLVEPEFDEIDNFEFNVDDAVDISTNSFFNALLANNDAPENKYPKLTSWWDENIDNPFSQDALDNRNKLKAHRDDSNMKFKVKDFGDFIEMFQNSEFPPNEQKFLDHFNNCYL